MDVLFRRETLNFSIDALFRNEKGFYTARIIPDINSEFYPPFHLRSINVSPDLIAKEFYASRGTYEVALKHKFIGSVVQGGYYEVPTADLKSVDAFSNQTVINTHNDIFKDHRKSSPYFEGQIRGNFTMNSPEAYNKLSVVEHKCDMHLYCFNVGQGDSFLLIPSSGNPYLIDTNLYSKKQAETFINKIREILSFHQLDPYYIKGLVITHKHIDHFRGARFVLEEGNFRIDNLFINQDYIHSTKSVHELLESAKTQIGTWINTNSPGLIEEGETKVYINNPDVDTVDSIVAPDINDSSICLSVSYKDNMIYMTGDAGYNVICEKYGKLNRAGFVERLLKVSHHGSDTGTHDSVLRLLNPTNAFVPVGFSEKYKHPHANAMSLLNRHIPTKILLSREERATIHYSCIGGAIQVNKC